MTPSELAQFFSQTNEYRSIKYDLRNMETLMERLGNPQESFRSVLIAGTNGKGSVAAFLAAMQPDTGLYTSPHLVRVNERIRIGTAEISDEDLTALHAEVRRAADKKGMLYPPSYFEMMTAIAFLYFRGRTEFAVLEVGMGGRLDATNVVRQDVSVITNIGLDHQEFLGATLDEIAAEKAGIIKSREPVVVGPDVESDVIRERAGEKLFMTRPIQRAGRSLGKGLFSLDVVTPIRQYRDLKPRLAGRHQIDNAVIAIRAAECLKWSHDDIVRGINSAVWPGRLEHIEGKPAYLLDGAHNEHATRALASFLQEYYAEGVSMVFACMADKNFEVMLHLLKPHVRHAVFTRVAGGRAEDPEKLRALWPGSHTAAGVPEALEQASANAEGGTVLVCGSLYLVGEAKRVLQ
jgi:dihydrofolate synthase/folylpolyglutamate synthase